MCKYWWSHRLLESSWKNFRRTVKWRHSLFLGYEGSIWHLEGKKNGLWYLSNAAAHAYRHLNCLHARCTVAEYTLPSLPPRVTFFQSEGKSKSYLQLLWKGLSLPPPWFPHFPAQAFTLTIRGTAHPPGPQCSQMHEATRDSLGLATIFRPRALGRRLHAGLHACLPLLAELRPCSLNQVNQSLKRSASWLMATCPRQDPEYRHGLGHKQIVRMTAERVHLRGITGLKRNH